MILGIVGLCRIGKRMAHIGRNVFKRVIAFSAGPAFLGKSAPDQYVFISHGEEDKVLSFEDGAVRVFVDPKSYLYLDGSTLGYSTSMVGRGFKFENPNVKGTCGCGESVQF